MNVWRKIKKQHPNYISNNKGYILIRKHVPVLLKAVFVAILFAIVQYFVNYYGFSFQKEAKEPILFLAMAFSFFVYVIFAGYAINRVLDESKEVSKAIVKKDLKTFLLYRDEQLPILIHLPLGLVAIIIIFFIILFPYPDEYIATTTVFAIVFMMALLFVIIRELDYYENSLWFREKTPQEWWDIEIDDYFSKK